MNVGDKVRIKMGWLEGKIGVIDRRATPLMPNAEWWVAVKVESEYDRYPCVYRYPYGSHEIEALVPNVVIIEDL